MTDTSVAARPSCQFRCRSSTSRPSVAARRPRRRCAIRSRSRARSSNSGTRGTGSPSTTTCPASRARRPRCCSRISPTRRRRSASGRVGSCCPTTHRSRSSSSSACSKRCIRVGSTSASGAHRAPTRSPLRALRRSYEAVTADEFPDQLGQLLAFFANSWPEGHPYAAHHRGARRAGTSPRSGCSARARGARTRRACSGCRSRSPTTSRRRRCMDALAVYRDAFVPSDDLAAPYVMLGVSVVVRGDRRARPLARRAGRPGVPPPAVGAARRVPDARGGGRVPVHAGRA